MNTTIHGLTPFPFRIVRIVADRELEGVESRACHQLLPELAECLSGKQNAIFVDASLDSKAKGVSVEMVIPTVMNAALARIRQLLSDLAERTASRHA